MSKEKETEKPIEVSLKPEDRELLKSAIEATKPKPEPTEHKHEHLTSDSVLTFFKDNEACPECKSEEAKLQKNIVKKFLKDRKNLEYECEECGTPVREDEEECPTCGSKDARSR